MSKHHKALKRALSALAALSLLAGPALAQTSAGSGTRGAAPRGAGAEGISGARASQPRGSRGLGGVRSRAPRPIGVTSRPGAAVGTQVSVPRQPTRVLRSGAGDRDVIRRGAGELVRRRDQDRRPVAFERYGPTGFWPGYSASGSLRDDDFWLRLHFGSPGSVIQHGRHRVYPKPHTYLAPGGYLNRWPYGRSYNTFPVYTYAQGYADPYVYYGPQYVAPPPPEPEPPPRELTTVETAELLTAIGRGEEAVELYRRHLAAAPDDAAAMRAMAVALLKAGRPAEAVAVAAMAYETDPSGLATQPVSASLFVSADDLRREVLRAVTYANRVNTPSSWLLVAALMQTEGRERTASQMVERAVGLGLSERVGGAMAAELSG